MADASHRSTRSAADSENDVVPELPNIHRTSVASAHSQQEYGGTATNGVVSARPQLEKPSAEVVVLSDAKWTRDDDLESAREAVQRENHTLRETLWLAFKALGIVYGDIGTSPLYAFSNIFLTMEPGKQDVLGATSLIIWTIILIVLVKYSLIVMLADDNGEGGTFALYSLICRYSRIGTPANGFDTNDEKLRRFSANSGLRRQLSRDGGKASWASSLLKRSKPVRMLLLFVVLSATAMVIGDGILTPAQSVLAAVSGLGAANATHNVHLAQGAIVGISCAILVLLYLFQFTGTNYLGWVFSPIVVAWLVFNLVIGVYNIVHWHPAVFQAISPHFAFKFLINQGHEGWVMLGGVLLCVTGAEAMYADLGHFTRASVQLGLYAVVLPSLLFTYLGQAAFLIRFPDAIYNLYYNSLPDPVYWPMFVIATLAAIVASQAMITAAFSIIRQSMQLGCFPRMKVVQTNSRIRGQIYIPEVNYVLMLLSVAAVGGFQTLDRIGSAYGVAVTFVFFITDILFALAIMVVWDGPWWLALAFFVFFGAIDGVYLSATLNKFTHGGWFPIAVAVAIFGISAVWFWGQSKKRALLAGNNVPLADVLENRPSEPQGQGQARGRSCGRPNIQRVSATSADGAVGMGEQQLTLRRNSITGAKDQVARIPGIGLMYAEDIVGVPPVFTHLLNNLPAIYQILVFVTVREVPVPHVDPEERYLIEPLDYSGFYRCLARYGYMETVDLGQAFEDHMVRAINRLTAPASAWPGFKEALRHRIAKEKVESAQQAKVVYLMGRVEMSGGSGMNIARRLTLEWLYNPIERNCRSLMDSWNIPRARLIEVGMSYELD